MTYISWIAIDTSKSVFTLHGVDAESGVVLRRNLRRRELLAFFEKVPPLEVALEACGGPAPRTPPRRRVAVRRLRGWS
jgi:transposase